MHCKTAAEVARAIKTMVIRGAPAIGVAAAMGLALGVQPQQGHRHAEVRGRVLQAVRADGGTRPTAVNLFWAIERMKRSFAAGVAGRRVGRPAARRGSIARPQPIHDEDVASCRAMGAYGAAVVPADARILTHCNAGALATAGYGTALGVIRGAVEARQDASRVFADETRPFLQGARLTAWELVRDGIDTTVITDNMAGALMRDGRHRPGRRRRRPHRRQRRHRQQDRHLHRGACSRSEHGIPFYVAAPLSTIDLDDAGRRAHSRSRSATRAKSRTSETSRLAPEGAQVCNPAFDVTPHALIAGIITERGIVARAVHRVAAPASTARGRRSASRTSIGRCVMLGIETSCDETAAAVVEETGDAGAAVGDPLERRRVAGRDPPRVGRRRARAGVAPARPRHLRRRRARAGATPASTLERPRTRSP